MKKLIILCFILLKSLSFSIPSLSELSFNVVFDHRRWSVEKEKIKGLLKNLPANIFKGQMVIGLDFSGLDLSGKDFTDCKFVKVNLAGADLTNTNFDNARFNQCNLIGAYFRYSLNDIGLERVFKITSIDAYELVRQYSDLMYQKEEKERMGLEEENSELAKQAECLNHLFGFLKLDLSHANLKNLNLIDINLKDVNLHHADLGGVRLSRGFKVPFYRESKDLFNKFKAAVNKNSYEKDYYLKLIRSRFTIFDEIVYEDLSEVNWEDLDLTNAVLKCLDLHGLNLKGVNFTGASLYHVDLRDTKLIGATFKNNLVHNVHLQGAWLSEDFRLDHESHPDLFAKWYMANINDAADKKYYDMLVLNGFTEIKRYGLRVFYNTLEKKHNIKSINFINETSIIIKLSGGNLSSSYFNKCVLKDIDLKNVNLSNSEFTEADLKNVNFNSSNLSKVKFGQATLKSVSFQGADLSGSDFSDAILENVDFYAANINDIKLGKTTVLQYDSNDDAIDFYCTCNDRKAKALLKIILKSRGVDLDQLGIHEGWKWYLLKYIGFFF